MIRSRIVIIALLLSAAIQAQHYMEVGLKAGLAGWSGHTNYVQPMPDLHAGLDIAYTYHSPQGLGYRIGLTLDRHQAAFGKNNYEDSYQTIDVDKQLMQIDYTIGRLKESYAIWSVGIPVQLSFTWERFSLYAGPKIVFPFSASWQEAASNAALSVYYPEYDNRIYDSYPLAASPDFTEQAEGKLSMPKMQWWLSAELNYSIPLEIPSRRVYSFLTIGAYFDYSFSPWPFEKTDTRSLIMLTDTRDGFPLQRTLAPVMSSNRQQQALVDRAQLFDVGIRVAYAISPFQPLKRNVSNCHCW